MIKTLLVAYILWLVWTGMGELVVVMQDAFYLAL